MRLSILIPTVVSRVKTFFPRIISQIELQYNELSVVDKSRVEIISLLDNKSIMLGNKRNIMIDIAKGDYVVQVDDDDRVAGDYIKQLLDATDSGADVITFKAEVTINGGDPKICIYSKDFERDHNTDTYNRLPNHICCIKRHIASQVAFPPLIYGEDSVFSKNIKPLLKTQTFIDRVLYYYDFNESTSETQEHLRPRASKRKYTPAILDLVILSNAKNDYFKSLTEQAIRTALETSRDYAINIIVMEENKRVSYGAKTVHYNEPFNYNKMSNMGARLGDSPYIMISNNDVIFRENWLFELLKANEPISSPKCPLDPRQKDVVENSKGHEIIKNFSGWCFMIKRHVWEQIGGFDEDFAFWYADNAVIEQFKKEGYAPMLVVNSLVEHLGSKTLKTIPEAERKKITYDQRQIFINKYKQEEGS